MEKETDQELVTITEDAAQVWTTLSKHSKEKKKAEAALARSAALLNSLKNDKVQVKVKDKYGLQNAEHYVVKKRKASSMQYCSPDNDFLSPSTSWSSYGGSKPLFTLP